MLYFVSCLLPLWLYFLTGADESARCVLPGEAADATFPKYFFSENGGFWEFFFFSDQKHCTFLPKTGQFSRESLLSVCPHTTDIPDP